MYLVSLGQLGIINDLGLRVSRCSQSRSLQGRFHNARLGATAAEIARTRVADLVGGWMWMLLQQRGYTHDETRRAIAAHEGVLLEKSLLHLGQITVFGQSFNCGDRPVLSLDGKLLTGINR